jgi:prophage antirepressor-like protein
MKELTKAFNGKGVRVILIKGIEWFVTKDICEILEIANSRDAILDFPDNEKSNVSISDVRKLGLEAGNRGLSVINETGLYRLIFRSRKPEAEAFKTWVFEEVLPSIRKTGKYEIPKSEKAKSIANRNYLTDQWQAHGVTEGWQYGKLTKEEYLQLFGDETKKKSEMTRKEIATLCTFETLEYWKLSEIQAENLGYNGCKASISQTVGFLDEIRQKLLA